MAKSDDNKPTLGQAMAELNRHYQTVSKLLDFSVRPTSVAIYWIRTNTPSGVTAEWIKFDGQEHGLAHGLRSANDFIRNETQALTPGAT